MISSLILAACYVLFVIAYYTGKSEMFGIGNVWFVVVWVAHILYFGALLLLREKRVVLPFSFLDRISEKPLSRFCNTFGPAAGGGCEVWALFLGNAVLAAPALALKWLVRRRLGPSYQDHHILDTIIALLGLYFGIIYLYRYLLFRLELMDEHRFRIRSWNPCPGWRHVESEACVDKRKIKALDELSCLAFRPILDDVVDPSGNGLQSWRALSAQKSEDWRLGTSWKFGTPDKPLDMTKSWDDPENLAAALPKPEVYFYPDETGASDEIRTCVVRIREIHEWLKATNPIDYDKAVKVYLVLVSPENAVPWTCPYDVSWRDLASGSVKLYDRKPIAFVAADGKRWTIDALPDTAEGWKRFLGIDKAVEKANVQPTSRG